MPYRCNINYVLSQDQNSKLLIYFLSQIIFVRLYLATIYLTSKVTTFISVDTMSKGPVAQHVMHGRWRGHPPGEDHRLSISVGHNNYDDLFAQRGTYRIEYRRGQPVHA